MSTITEIRKILQEVMSLALLQRAYCMPVPGISPLFPSEILPTAKVLAPCSINILCESSRIRSIFSTNFDADLFCIYALSCHLPGNAVAVIAPELTPAISVDIRIDSRANGWRCLVTVGAIHRADSCALM